MDLSFLEQESVNAEFQDLVERIVGASLNHTSTKLYDQYQKMTNGIEPWIWKKFLLNEYSIYFNLKKRPKLVN